MLFERLFKPLDYLRVHHPQKRKYDLWFPLIISIVVTLVLFFLPIPVQMLGDKGLVSIFTGLLQILTGFYIASLAAVATFDRGGMDEVMPGKALTLRIKRQGKWETESLTRRRFLSLMFGYLSLLSFFLYFLGSFIELLEPNLAVIIPPKIALYVRWFSTLVYLFLVANLMISTLLSLFYMADRIHRDDPKIIIKKNLPPENDSESESPELRHN